MVALLSHALEELRSVLRLTEEEAQAMLEAQVLRERLQCPRCAAKKLYALKSRRWRCANCRYTFGLLAGRWVSTIRIPAKTWLVALKAFESGLPAESTGQLTGLSRPTLYKVLNTIRLALAARDPRWSRVTSARFDDLVYGVKREEGKIELEPLAAPVARELTAQSPNELHRDGVVFTAPAGRYASLVSNGRNKLGRRGPERETGEPFLKYLKVQTSRHYSIPRRAFPLYLMEWELRFNRSGKPWFEDLLVAVTRPTPRVA